METKLMGQLLSKQLADIKLQAEESEMRTKAEDVESNPCIHGSYKCFIYIRETDFEVDRPRFATVLLTPKCATSPTWPGANTEEPNALKEFAPLIQLQKRLERIDLRGESEDTGRQPRKDLFCG
jgi:hypothetical protein